MILKGNQRGFGQELARHLLNVEDNEHAAVHDLRGFMADDLAGAFEESEAISLGTKCQQYLFSLSLNPPPSARVSVEQFEKAIDEVERRLGLTCQPRAIVFHEKKGRRHAHCVWSRIDVARMRAIDLPHTKYRLRDISRELYLEHGWEMPKGLRDPKDRSNDNYSAAEAKQAARAKRDPAALKKLFRTCWQQSDSRAAFAAALWRHGLFLARGDRRGFVAVDANSEVYSLSRGLGVKPKKLRARLGKEYDLPTVDEAARLLERSSAKAPEIDERSDKDFDAQLRDLEQRRQDLVEQQRAERTQLKKDQAARRITEIATRSARLPTGLKAAWARLTGQYQRLCENLASQAQAFETRDRNEEQTLIDGHLTERRVLEREFALIRAERDFYAEASGARRQTYGLDPKQPLIIPREEVPFSVDQLRHRPDLILDHISKKQATFTQNDVLRGLAEFFGDAMELRTLTDQAMASDALVHLSDEGGRTVSTKEFEAAKTLLSDTASAMAASGGFRVSGRKIDRAIAEENTRLQKRVGATLSNEQIGAIRHILSPNQLACVVGLAGAGKSTLLSVARVAWERQGFSVFGAALAGKAADSLQTASRISARTLASLEASWKSGYEPLPPGSILVIDEAGMVGTRQLNRVAEGLQRRGCKLVLIGDPDQLQPIEAGIPFADLVDGIGAARLTEIRRQTSAWQRQASVDLARGDTDTAIQSYADHGAVHVEQNRDQAIAALVDDYMDHWRKHGTGKTRLALAHRRKDVHAINQSFRSARRIQDGVRDEVMVENETGPRAFAEGDRILFTRNNATLGVRNGMLGTVQAISDDRLVIALDADAGGERRRLTISPKHYPHIDHGFAVSIHRAQGCTVDQSFILSSRTMDEHLAYVALTRHREKARFYTANEVHKNREKEGPFLSQLGTKSKWRSGPALSR
ncbi:MAG: AAA family ATPase [Rhodobacter sp.]|nr:AAA family ATPase [Rhodobacter sp.]